MRNVHVLDLDGSLMPQSELFGDEATRWTRARHWGPQVRLACSFARFNRFQHWLGELPWPPAPCVTCYGSGDFHHVTLALLRRIAEPFNLLVLDKHPDWMRGIPFLHCGTWLRHALRLPGINRVFHCGGDLDFDNAYGWLAPWQDIQSRRIVVLPARRRFVRGRWAGIEVEPLLNDGVSVAHVLSNVLGPFRDELARLPLYISIDKDVLSAEDAAVNWDSGFLRLPEAQTILETFLDAAQGQLIGADLLGDWSPIELGHWLNRLCDRLDHPSPVHGPDEAARRNERANTMILETLQLGSV
ncbi:MAG: hypothetical protein ACP5XB_13800 [Isosphaeraceae bacterium]